MWYERGEYSMEIQGTKKIFIAYSTRDKTEGRSPDYPWKISESKTCAIRLGKKGYVMGSDCPVKEGIAVKINNQWYAPCNFEKASDDDLSKDMAIEAKTKALEKARELGLSEEEIKIISSNNP